MPGHSVERSDEASNLEVSFRLQALESSFFRGPLTLLPSPDFRTSRAGAVFGSIRQKRSE